MRQSIATKLGDFWEGVKSWDTLLKLLLNNCTLRRAPVIYEHSSVAVSDHFSPISLNDGLVDFLKFYSNRHLNH